MDCIIVGQTTQQEIVKSTRHFWFPVSKIYFLIFLYLLVTTTFHWKRLLKKLKEKLRMTNFPLLSWTHDDQNVRFANTLYAG